MRIVVTGATGNVGTSLLTLLALEPEVEKIVGIARRKPDTVFTKTEFVSANVAEDSLLPYFRGADAVVHLAWQIQPAHRRHELERANIEGSRRVFEAASEAGVRSLVVASSVGAYSRAISKQDLVSETYPTEGIASSGYSRDKARVEELLDAFQIRFPELRIVRLRPALIFKRSAALGIRRLFIGSLVPRFVFRGGSIPFIPDHPTLRFQALHSADVAEAYRLALLRDVRGAFNLAADPILDPQLLSKALKAPCIKLPRGLLKGLMGFGFYSRLIKADPGWLDLALESPLIDTARAREVLGWEPQRSSLEALCELLEGLEHSASFNTPPLSKAARPVRPLQPSLTFHTPEELR